MARDHLRPAAVAVVSGLLLGALDFLWIRFMPAPVAHLGNSSAVWAVAAFWFGYGMRSLPVIGAVVMLGVAVPSYYLTATLVQHDDLAVIVQPTSLLWMAFGVLAGVLFGTAGTWARRDGWRHVVGAALPGAVLFAEAGLIALRYGNPSYDRADVLWEAALNVALGVVVICLAARARLWALAAAVPVAAVGMAAFAVARFG